VLREPRFHICGRWESGTWQNMSQRIAERCLLDVIILCAHSLVAVTGGFGVSSEADFPNHPPGMPGKVHR